MGKGMGDGTGIPEGGQATGEALVMLYMNRIRKFVCLFVCLSVSKLLLGKKSNLHAVFTKRLEIYPGVHSFKE